MSQDLYENLDAPIPTMAWAKEYGLSKAIVALWDTSLTPGNNDVVKKLGKGEGQHGGVIWKHDTDTNEASLADGLSGHPKVNSRRPFNPDNWVFRAHEPFEFNGKASTWDVRIVAEHENQSDQRGNQGTIVVNQKDNQQWGWLNDIAWVRALGSTVSDPEIMFNGAGFLSTFYGPNGGGGSSKRAVVATPTCRNGGFVTDGKYDGQWAQAGKFIIGPTALKKPTPTTTGTPTDGSYNRPQGNINQGQNGFNNAQGTGGGGYIPGGGGGAQNGINGGQNGFSQAQAPSGGGGINGGQNGFSSAQGVGGGDTTGHPGGSNADTTGASPYGTQDQTVTSTDQTVTSQGGGDHDNTQTDPLPPEADPNSPLGVEWGMRADCGIDYGNGKIGRLMHEPATAKPGNGKPKLVKLFLDTYVSPDDHLDTETDDSSNHKPLPKKVLKKVIHGWVNIPDPSPYETHTDYSYHGPPPNTSSSSQSGSGTPTPGGAPVPPGTGTDPDDTDAESGGQGYDGVPAGEGGDGSGTGGGSNTGSGGETGGDGTPGAGAGIDDPNEGGGPGDDAAAGHSQGSGGYTGPNHTETAVDRNGNTWARVVPENPDGTPNVAATGPWTNVGVIN